MLLPFTSVVWMQDINLKLESMNQMEAFEMCCRRILKISWMPPSSNAEILSKTRTQNSLLLVSVKKNKVEFFRHIRAVIIAPNYQRAEDGLDVKTVVAKKYKKLKRPKNRTAFRLARSRKHFYQIVMGIANAETKQNTKRK